MLPNALPALNFALGEAADLLRDSVASAPTRSAWPQALAETIEWYRSNEDWWRPLKDASFEAYYREHYGKLGLATA